MRRIFFLAAAALWLCNTVPALADPQAITPEIGRLLKETADGTKYGQAGAVILLSDAAVKVGPSGYEAYTLHVIGRVLDSRAATAYSNVRFGFNSHYSAMELDFARSISPEGVVAATPPNAVQVKNPEGPVYSDARTLAFAIPALGPGSVFEYRITEKWKASVIEGAWFGAFNLAYVGSTQRIDPVHLSKFTVVVPEHARFRYETQNTTVKPIMWREGKTETYRWETRDIPAVKIEDNMPCAIHELTPNVRLSSLGTWAQVEEWAAKKILAKIETSLDVRRKAEELVAGTTNRREKMERLFDFVQSRVRYIQADLALGGYEAHPAAEVLHNLFGDCKDQAVLLASLLRAVNIEAYPALIGTCDGMHHGDLPVPEFNHVIVYVPGADGDIWLDTTSGACDFPRLLLTDQGKRALVIDGKGGRFLTTPLSGPDENLLEVGLSFTVKDGGFVNDLSVKATGAVGTGPKAYLIASPESARKELLTDVYKRMGYKGTNVSATYPNIANASAALVGEGQFRIEPFVIDPKMKFAFSGTLSPLLDMVMDASTLPKPDDRTHDYRLPHAFLVTAEWLCPPPVESMRLETLGTSSRIDGRFLRFSETYSKEGEALKVRMEVRTKETRIKKEDYKSFFDEVQKVLDRSKWRGTFLAPVSRWETFKKGLRSFPLILPPSISR
jgi:hypothetical protein